MFYPLRVWLVSTLANDSVMKSLLAKRPDGVAAIYPFHHRDVKNPSYPLITIERTGSTMNSGKFSGSDFSNLIDGVKFSLCIWDKLSVDNTEAIYSRVRDTLLNAKNVGNEYFSSTQLNELMQRSDLFDAEANAYHFHSEWQTWVFENATTRQPIPG